MYGATRGGWFKLRQVSGLFENIVWAWSMFCSSAVTRDVLFSILWVWCDHLIVLNLDTFPPRLGDLDGADFDGE